MTIPAHQLEAEVLSLGDEDRARILERLIESFDGASKVQDVWLEEALRREAEALAGEVALVPGDEALARIRAQLP